MVRPKWNRRIGRLEAKLPSEDLAGSVVVIPGTGRRVSLVEARERLLERESWLGIPSAVMRKKLEKQIADFEKLKRVVELSGPNVSNAAIARETGLSSKTIAFWRRGERLPRNVSFARADLYERMRKPFEVRPGQENNFAYVLGAMFGKKVYKLFSFGDREMKISRIRMEKIDPQAMNEFRRRLSASTGLELKAWKHPNRKDTAIETGSRSLVQVFNRSTDYGRNIPRFFLLTPQARLEFAKGIFDNYGYVKVSSPRKTRNVFLFTGQLPLPVVEFISKTLKNRGFNPKLRKAGLFLPAAETRRFAEEIGFRVNSKQAILAR